VVSGRRTEPAALPPSGLPGLDPAWSRLVSATDVDGIERTWHVLDTGGDDTAGTLLCVHGNPTWSYLWRELVGQASPGWRVVAVDHLDMGYSERTGTERRLERRIDDLQTVTTALGLRGPVVTVAHDWGGPISLGWALRHRDDLAGIVLTNTAVHQPPGSPAPALIRLARTPGVLDAACVRTPAFVRGTMALARPRLPRPVQHAYAAPYGSADRRRAIGGFVADIPLEPQHPSAAALDAVAVGLADLAEVPALLLWGPADPVFSDRYLHDLQARLPQAEVHRFGGASHLVVEDADVAGTVGTWLADRDRARRGAGPPPPRDAAEEGGRAPLWSALEDPANAARPAIVQLPTSGRTLPGRRVPDRTPTVRSFAELATDIRDLAAGMAASGVRPGHRVALLVPPGIELATSLFACWRLGAVVVLADAGLGARGMTRALKSAAPDHLIGIPRALVAARTLGWPGRRIAAGAASDAVRTLTGTSTSLEELRSAGAGRPPPVPPDDDAEAAVVFTSGATGTAKGVVYRHRQIQAQRDALVRTYGITSADRLVAAFAPFALYGPAMGITSVVPDMDVTSPGTLRAAALAEAAAAVEATLVFASPAAIASVLATAEELDDGQRDALRGVRLLMSAGAPVPAELLRSAGRLLPSAEPHTPYGMTEVLPVADISLAGIDAAGPGNGVCVGAPLPGVDVAISPIDHLGRAVGELTDEPEATGEICVRADHVKDRYDRLWATERASSRDLGWHRSGDVGHLDDDGRLWVEGRLVHVIATADGPVTPVGIERRVEGIAHVRLAAAVGVGPTGTQQVVVVVSTDPAAPRGALAPTTLTAAVRRVVDVPVAAVLVAPELPVDIRHNSKIDRARIADWATRMLAGDRPGRL
jgi:olefin beta-lactone synthetase